MNILLLAAALALAPAGISAAAEARAGGSFLRADDHRVAEIAHRLALKGARFCPVLRPWTGLLFHHVDEYEAAGRAAMIDRYQLGRGLGVLSVVGGSPAGEAGLVAGDVILSVNGEAIRRDSTLAPSTATARRAVLESAEMQIEQAIEQGPVDLLVQRAGAIRSVGLGSTPACPSRIRLARSRQTNAFANGRYVTLTTAVLEFVRSDDELAVIIAHEMAHNILEHPDRLREQDVPRGLLRGFGTNAAKIRATEEEADRLGIRLVWAAGFDASAAIPFWRRFYERFDGPRIFRTHPTLAARERIIAETLASLDAGAQGPELGKGALADR